MSAPDVFLLNPENRDYVAGAAPLPAADPTVGGDVALRYVWVILIAFFGLGPAVFVAVLLIRGANPQVVSRISLREGLTAVAFSLAWLGGSCVLLYANLRAVWRLPRADREFRKNCRVVHGEIVNCSASIGLNGEYAVLVNYRFQSPPGVVLEGTGQHDRQDLVGRLLPEPRTPVAVAYLTDQRHRLL